MKRSRRFDIGADEGTGPLFHSDFRTYSTTTASAGAVLVHPFFVNLAFRVKFSSQTNFMPVRRLASRLPASRPRVRL